MLIVESSYERTDRSSAGLQARASPSSSASCSLSRSSRSGCLVYDRQQQSEFAQASIAEGWGGPQVMSGRLLVIPYRATTTETVTEGTQQVTRSREVWRELTLAPERVALTTETSGPTGASARSMRWSSMRPAFMAVRASSCRSISPGPAWPWQTWISRGPSCASAFRIRAASAPIRGSASAACRCGCSRRRRKWLGR